MKLNFQFIYISIILIFGFSACDSGHAGAGQSYEEAQLTIEQTEKVYPKQFIHSDGSFRKNLVGKWVIEGSIKSSATVATYKDVVLDVTYYSKTNSLIGSEQHTLYEYLTPRQTVKFKFKSFGYKGAESIGLGIADASPIN
ncbi:hypothetical protein [Adhaeribacter soli]|uniref:Uncharacterized protein n=1 Tax=Adhaeribacter soli TaxID=2607655 RepID=A0A5N1IXI3_9BACT|nr:hypothetical protein [Adhaeribacter soli]KAA9338961.1 hypothetical protein F0P94_09225 [Adhaeribacter soli]